MGGDRVFRQDISITNVLDKITHETQQTNQMKIKKRTLVYLSQFTEAWAEPIENNVTHIEAFSKLGGGRKISGALSSHKFPKALLEYQLKKMLEVFTPYAPKPFLKQCVVGRWGFKKALKLHEKHANKTNITNYFYET